MMQTISREFSDPAIAISAILEKIKTNRAGITYDNLVDKAAKHSDYIMALSDDLQEIAEVGIDQSPLRKEGFNIEDVILVLLDKKQVKTHHKEVRIEVDWGTTRDLSRETVYSDHIRMRVILSKMFDFAIQGARPGTELCVRIYLVQTPDSIAVSIEFLFSANEDVELSQSKQSLDSEVLGCTDQELRIAAGIAKSLNGHMTLSGQNKTVYALSLNMPVEYMLPTEQFVDSTSGKARILLFEDTGGAQNIAVNYLRSKGVDVLTVDRVDNISDHITTHLPDVVLVDESALNRSDDSLERTIKTLRELKRPFAVLLNESNYHELGSPAEEDNVNVILKPVTGGKLYEMVSSQIETSATISRIFGRD